MAELSIEIKGMKEKLRQFQALIGDLAASGGLQGIVAKATLRALRYATRVTHVVTGRLKNSHYPRVTSSTNVVYGSVSTNVAYAVYEHDRGGSHAFYQRTADEEGPAIAAAAARDVRRAARRANR